MARTRVPPRPAPPVQVLTASAGTASAGSRRTHRAAASSRKVAAALSSSTAVFRQNAKKNPNTERNSIAKAWQVECYRHVNICGEARYAATLFAAMASRAEVGVSEPQALVRKAVWVSTGEEADVFAELAPTVRERSKLIRDFMLHYIIAGECYLVARPRVDTDTPVPEDRKHEPLWEVVAVTEIQKDGTGEWSIRHDNGNYIELDAKAPVIRIWNPDPSDRREAWSPFRSMLATLGEIEYLTRHIFTQVRSRLMSAGVWFLPDNLTFPPPPEDMVEGGAEAIAEMNEPEQFMVSLALSSAELLESDEVSFPTVVMADPEALKEIDRKRLIEFWSEIDDAAMKLRSDAVRRFALGMDLPPEQVLGSSGMAVSGSAGAAGSTNHWCVDDQTEVLTRFGWVRQDALTVGTEVYTLNHETGLAEWNPVKDIYRADVVDERMTRMQGRDHDSLTTPGHRWPVIRDMTVNSEHALVREFRTTAQLTEHDRITTAAPGAELPREAKYSDAFVELAAWFWTEGSLGTHKASISQSIDRNPERVARIRAALAQEFPGGWGEHEQTGGFNDSTIQVFRLHKHAREALRAIGGKFIEPAFIDSLTAAQLELFIDVSCQGDGWHYRQGRLDIWQRDPRALVAYERALILSGRAVSWGAHAGGEFVSDRRGKTTVRPRKFGPGSAATVEDELYSGVVWCPVTENSTWLARRNGSVYFTGNSVWANEEQSISAHVEPALDLFTGVLTEGYLRAAIPDTELVIAYDTASLRLKQDRSAESIELYDRGVLKAEVMLRENGFDPDNDQMDDAEFRRWLLTRIAGGSATPEQVQAAIKLLGVALPVVPAQQEGASAAPGTPGRNLPRTLDGHPHEGKPREDHDHNPAPYSLLTPTEASAEALVLRALEKYGNRLLNHRVRGRDRDRTTPPTLAHLSLSAKDTFGHAAQGAEFDMTHASTMLDGVPGRYMDTLLRSIGEFCATLVNEQRPYLRADLIAHLRGVDFE